MMLAGHHDYFATLASAPAASAVQQYGQHVRHSTGRYIAY